MSKKKEDFREHIPSGFMTGIYYPIGDDTKTKPASVNLFPMNIEYRQGVGIIDMDRTSYKFNWESDSVLNESTWNISFSKDNNLYANLNENFSFVGVLKADDLGLSLVGTITIKDKMEGEKLPYYLEVTKYLDPEIILKGEGLTATVDEPLTLTVSHVGEETKEIEVILEAFGDDEKVFKLKAVSIKKAKNGTISLITSNVTSEIPAGDYNLYLVRSGESKSNKIKVTI